MNLLSHSAKCLSTTVSLCGDGRCKVLQNGPNDQIKGHHLYAPALFGISKPAPVGGLIGLESSTSRRLEGVVNMVREEEMHVLICNTEF